MRAVNNTLMKTWEKHEPVLLQKLLQGTPEKHSCRRPARNQTQSNSTQDPQLRALSSGPTKGHYQLQSKFFPWAQSMAKVEGQGDMKGNANLNMSF